MPEESLVERCKVTWEQTWGQTFAEYEQEGDLPDTIEDEDLRSAIHTSINSRTKTYRYVLPTQLISKYTDPELDAKCIQAKRGGPGAFDARSVAHDVIVPFDRAHHNVLGGSPEPYVNNPLRVEEISQAPKFRDKQKDKEGWDNLHLVLDTVQGTNSPDLTMRVLRQAQIEIARRLSEVHIVYPAPRRVSIKRVKEIREQYISTPSGGDRPQAIATALFRVIGRYFGLFTEVRRAKTTAADAASGQIADIECLDEQSGLVLAIEVKDVKLEISHIEEKLPRVREQSVSDLFFLVREGIEEDQYEAVQDTVRDEFSSGHNIYIFDLVAFADVVLSLVGEQGRGEFLREVGAVLDEYASPLSSRREWASLLRQA